MRGGLFENTGFKTGAVTVTDPQTGHYAAELPIEPALLSLPEIHTESKTLSADSIPTSRHAENPKQEIGNGGISLGFVLTNRRVLNVCLNG